LLKGARLAGRRRDRSPRGAIGVGIAASFVSTLASQRLIALVERDRALWPYAAYRIGLAALVLARLRRRPSPGIESPSVAPAREKSVL
jgi:hypothetical protein